MKNGLRKRIARLEQRIGGEAVIVTMKDGSVHQITGTAKHFLRLAAQINTENPLGELLWIRDAVGICEPAHAYELLQALLKGPIETEEPER